jgi:hypothetical protein
MADSVTESYKGVEITVRQVEGPYCTCWSARLEGADCCERPAHLTLFDALDHAKALIDRSRKLEQSL